MKHWLLTYVRTYWPGIGLFAVLSLGATGLQLASPWPMKVLIDSAIGHLPAPGPLAAYTHTQTLLAILAFGLVLIYLLHNVFDFWASAFSAKLVYKIDYAVKSQLFDHIMHLAGRSLDRKRSGDYLYRTNVETQMVSSLLVGTTVTMIGSVVMIVGVLAILWQMNSFMAVISLCMIPLLILSIRFFSSPMAEASQQVELSTSEVYGYGEESIAHVPLVQSFNHEADQLSKLQQLMARNFSDRRRSIYLGNWFGLSNDMIATLAVAALVAIGGQRVFSGQLTIGELVLFLTYITYLYGPLQSLTGAIGSVPAALAAIRRVYDVLEHEQPVPQLVSPEHVDQVRGSLQLNHVSFSYGQHQVLSDITLGIAPGQKVAIYGPSGGGKSTLLELLLRFYDVGSGSITLDGLNLREYDLADLRRQFALVDQEPVLFSGTVAENIAYGRTGPKADLDQLVAAAGAANAYDFIMTLPQAFDTPVGEGGSLLSGGQKQRIAIARAFLKNAPILLLDEPTSALDAGSEAAVVEALDRLMRGRTSIVVGHNLEVISRADVVYLMENGQLSGRTTPAELMAQSRTAVGTAGLVTAEQPSVVAEMQPAKI